jgi:hypothetical protein
MNLPAIRLWNKHLSIRAQRNPAQIDYSESIHLALPCLRLMMMWFGWCFADAYWVSRTFSSADLDYVIAACFLGGAYLSLDKNYASRQLATTFHVRSPVGNYSMRTVTLEAGKEFGKKTERASFSWRASSNDNDGKQQQRSTMDTINDD